MSRSTSSTAFNSTRTTPRRHLLPSSSSLPPFARSSSSSSSQNTKADSLSPLKDGVESDPSSSSGSKVPSSYRARLEQQLEEEKFFARQTNELARSLPRPKPKPNLNGPAFTPSFAPSRSPWKVSAYNSYGNLITSSPLSSPSSARTYSPRTSLSTPRTPLDVPPRRFPSSSSGQFLRSITPVYGSRQDAPLPSTFGDEDEDYTVDYKLRVQARLNQDVLMSLRTPNPLSPSSLDLSSTPSALGRHVKQEPFRPLKKSSLPLKKKPDPSPPKSSRLEIQLGRKAEADFDASRIYEMDEKDLHDAAELLVKEVDDGLNVQPEQIQAICIRSVTLRCPRISLKVLMKLPLQTPGALFFAPASSLRHHPPWFVRGVLSSYTSFLRSTPPTHRLHPSNPNGLESPGFIEELDGFVSRLGQIDPAIFPGDPVIVALALRAFDAFLRGPMEDTEPTKRELAEVNYQKIVGLITKPEFEWSMGTTFSLGEHGKEDLEISLAGLPEELRNLRIWKTVRTTPPRRLLQNLIDLHRPPPAGSNLPDGSPSSSPSSSPSEPIPPAPISPPPLSPQTIQSHLSSLPFSVYDDPILALQSLELFSLTLPSEEGQSLFDLALQQTRACCTPSSSQHRDSTVPPSLLWHLAPEPAPTLSPPSSSPSPLSSLDPNDPSPKTPPSKRVLPIRGWILALTAHRAMSDLGGPTYDELKATLERMRPLLGENVKLWNGYLKANDPEMWEGLRQALKDARRTQLKRAKQREWLKGKVDASKMAEPTKEKDTPLERLARTLSIGLSVR